MEIQVVIVHLNNYICGIETPRVYKIVKYQDVMKPPEMPKFIDGMTRLAGIVIPVIDLNKRFGLGELSVNKKTKIIVSRVNEMLVGFIVNNVSEITMMKEEDIEKAPEMIKDFGNRYLKSVAKQGTNLISILDFNKIFNDNEINELEKQFKY